MNHSISTLLITACLAIQPLADVRAGVSTQSRESLVARVEARDVAAIVAAGKSGDGRVIPSLRKVVGGRQYRGITDESPTEQARLALARLGETAALQEFWCAATSEAPSEVALNPPIETFQFIGGWYAIRSLRYFLGPNGEVHWRRAGQRVKQLTDVVYESPREIALRVLPQVVPDSPIVKSQAGMSHDALEREARIWQDWLATAEPKLNHLVPTGEDVDFSAGAPPVIHRYARSIRSGT